MSKPIPEKTRDEDGDYEIVSFEDFCDKSPSSKTDLLNLNDNINYRLCFEGDAAGTFSENLCEGGEGSSRQLEDEKETSLSEKSVNWKRKAATTFAPFGRYGNRPRKSSLLGGVMSKPRMGEGDSSKQHRYERFSSQRSLLENIRSNMPGRGVSCLLLLCVIGAAAAWWGVAGALSGSWGDEHYRRLWERAHPDGHPPHAPPTHPVEKQVAPENRYHDHNNLSIKNKNATLKKEINKKSNDAIMVTEVSETNEAVCSRIDDVNMRFDCFPQDGANEEGCLKRGCCWNASIEQHKLDGDGIPYCFYPDKYETFHFINMTETKLGITVYYEKRLASGYPDDFDLMRIEFKYVSKDVLHIRIADPVHLRFDPSVPGNPTNFHGLNEKSFRVIVESAQIGFKVIRNSDNVTIMDTSKGGIIMSDKFLQISNLLPTNKLYGLGEHRAKFLVDMNWKTRTLFNFDTPPTENQNLYGMHPYFLALENNGNAHGVVLINSNAMDVVLQPTPAITYRTVGGILNFYVMLGPTPAQVTQQYYALIGYPFLPPYWSLGFHLCKYGYGSLNVTKQVWMNNRNAGIPFDVQWNDLDYMNDSKDFTYDKQHFYGLPDFVKKLHKEGMKYMLLIDPGISGSETVGSYPPFDRGIEMDIFIKNASGEPFVGKVWNRLTTVYPDFTHPNATAYWVEMIGRLHKMIPFDGAWIDMNEPSNFISGSMFGQCEPENLPYKPRMIGKDGLKTKTLCMDAKHFRGKHFDYHALYSFYEAVTTHFAMAEVRGGRPFVITRSTFPGIGKYAGHWSGDIASDWHDMRMTIPELLNFNLFGVPMMGADICGFRGDTTPLLCKRWMQLGAFYPFSRNHNSDTSIPQDPYSLGPEVIAASREALRVRYSLLPHYYTLFWLAHTQGDAVARPLFYHYPTDENTHAIDEQFLIGPGLLISPILYPNVSTSSAYLPDAHHWCSVRTGQCYPKGKFILYERDTVLLGGGNIIVSQSLPDSGPITTKLVRKFPLNIQAVEDKDGLAEGVFYSDDGERFNSYSEKRYTHIEFQIKERQLTSKVLWWGYGVPPVNNITIYGVAREVVSVTLDDNLCSMPKCDFAFDEHKNTLRIYHLSLSLDKQFSITWTLQKDKRNK